jgi:tetrahydromethanopterin S-methyltransferase subunit B
MTNLPPPLPPSSPEVISYAQPAFVLPFPDRRTGLRAWGIVLIVLGAISGCITLTIPFGAALLTAVPVNQTPNRNQVIIAMIFAAIIYAVTAGLLVWTGIASLRFRKWVRPIVLTASALVMAVSTAGIISLIVTGLATARNMGNMTVTTFNPTTAPGVTVPPTVTTRTVPGAAAGMWFGVVFGAATLALVGLLLPGAMFWFYRQPDTALTLQYFDTAAGWTDRAPMPVLGVALAATFVMLSLLFTAVQQIVIASSINKAVVITAVSLVIGFLMFFTAALNFHFDRRGWVAAVIATIVAAAGWMFVIYSVDIGEQFKSFGLAVAESGALDEFTRTQRLSQTVSAAVLTVAALAYLMWCKKFYDGAVTPRA